MNAAVSVCLVKAILSIIVCWCLNEKKTRAVSPCDLIDRFSLATELVRSSEPWAIYPLRKIVSERVLIRLRRLLGSRRRYTLRWNGIFRNIRTSLLYTTVHRRQQIGFKQIWQRCPRQFDFICRHFNLYVSLHLVRTGFRLVKRVYRNIKWRNTIVLATCKVQYDFWITANNGFTGILVKITYSTKYFPPH